MDKKQRIEASVEIMASCVVDAIIKILTRVEEPYIRQALDTFHILSCSDVEIMRTSAGTLEYNPEFFVKTPIDQLVMLVRHEAMHACHLHIRKFGKPAYTVVEGDRDWDSLHCEDCPCYEVIDDDLTIQRCRLDPSPSVVPAVWWCWTGREIMTRKRRA